MITNLFSYMRAKNCQSYCKNTTMQFLTHIVESFHVNHGKYSFTTIAITINKNAIKLRHSQLVNDTQKEPLTFEKYSGHPPHQWPFPQFYLCFARTFFIIKRCRLKICCLNIFSGGSARTPSTSFVGCRQIFYDIKTSSHFLHNEYEFTNKWWNLSTNRLLPTVLLLSLSSVSILNYARLQQCQMFANLYYTKITIVKMFATSYYKTGSLQYTATVKMFV